jgi:hypothetical protein
MLYSAWGTIPELNHSPRNDLMNRRQALLTAGAAIGAAGTALVAGPMLGATAEACELKGTPLEAMHLHLCAFHVAKDDPKFQLVAHHFCMDLGEEYPGVFQCIVCESNKVGARILGVEYIVPDEIYQKLPKDEKEFWHSHDYEVTSGQLVAPKLSEEDENKFLKVVRKTWGKTFHTWADPATKLPLGKPRLMVAFIKEGEIREELIKKRDRELGIDTEKMKKRRVGKV